MRYIVKKNLQVIKKYYSERLINNKSEDLKSIENELYEWITESFNVNDDIWTLPDLTRTERLENFCRSIKKKLN